MHATPKDVAGLKKLAGAFSANRVGTARAMREIHQMNPEGFLDATIEVLRESPEGAGARYLLAMLLAQPDSLERICDPEQFSPAQSVTLVQQAKALDPQVEVKLARLVAKLTFETDGQANLGNRVLEILGQAADPCTALPALRQLLACPNARIRSKAALLIGRISRNPQWAKLAGAVGDTKLGDAKPGDTREDQRVVANAIESLWGLDTPAAKDAFHEAVNDARNRVAGNGAIGLYMAGDLEGAEALFRFSRNEQWLFRSTAAWCMGRTADPRFLPQLAKLIKDPAPGVRTTAFRGVALASQRVKSLKKAGSVPLQICTMKYHEGAHNLQVLLGDGGPETRGFGALSFVVTIAQDVVERFTLEELHKIPPVMYNIAFEAPLAEARLVKVEIYTERGTGEGTGTELAS